MSGTAMDQNPLAALSLLSLAASHQPRTSFNNTLNPNTLSPTLPTLSHLSLSSPTIAHANPLLSPLNATPTSPPAVRSPSLSRSTAGPAQKHRRMSSTGQRSRRLSEATAATASALVRGVSASSTSAISATPAAHSMSSSPPAAQPAGSVQKYMQNDIVDPDEVEMATSANGKKKVIYRCETCSKAYRHPNCLLKHRWEHSPHWREASKFLLSKHQQVQLLEAAAILSHISPGDPNLDPANSNGRGTSLPDDRSLWPSYLSGGMLPVPGQESKASAKASSKDGALKHDEVSSGEDEEPRDRDSGYGSGGLSGLSSSSLPPSSAMPVNTPSLGSHHSNRGHSEKSSSPNPISPGTSVPALGTFGTGAFHYGSVGNMPLTAENGQDRWSSKHNNQESGGKTSGFTPSQSVGHKPFAGSGAFTGTRTMPYPTSTSSTGRSRSRSISSRHNGTFTAAIPPPPFHRNRPGQHTHTRASSSISSSYTRSSIRGDGDDEEDDDDDGFILDIDEPFAGPRSSAPFTAPQTAAGSSYSRSAFSSSVPNSFTAPHQMYHSSSDNHGDAPIGVLHERDERDGDDGDDTVDEESLEGDGAGMEIDTMEL